MVRLNQQVSNINPNFLGTNNTPRGKANVPAQVSFGEGKTQQLIEMLVPGVKEKRQGIEKAAKEEGKSALGLVRDILTAHIPANEEGKTTAVVPATTEVVQPVVKPVVTVTPVVQNNVKAPANVNNAAATVVKKPLNVIA